MGQELQRKIEWLKWRHEEQAVLVKELEDDRRINRSDVLQRQLRDAKKEKLRLKDMIAVMEQVMSNNKVS